MIPRRFFRLARALLLFGFCLLFSCHPEDESHDRTKVILIGIDGADWEIITRLAQEKKLPTMERLLSAGCAGTVSSLPPLISPALWTTIATGYPSPAHGITDFVTKASGSYAKQHFLSGQRKRKAVWNILSDHGFSAGVIRWFVTYPAERVNGFMVGYRYEDHIQGGDDKAYFPAALKSRCRQIESQFSYPDEALAKKVLSLECEDAGDARSIRGVICRKRITFLKSALLRDSRVAHLAFSLLSEQQPHLSMVYLNGIDRISHKFWKFHDAQFPQPDHADSSDKERATYATLIDDYYQFTDALIGSILSACAPDTDVIVVSDHGFRASRFPDDARFCPNTLLADLDLLKFSSSGEVDYSQTIAFNFSDEYQDLRGIYLNLEGRDPEGIVRKQDQEHVQRFLLNSLSALRTSSGKPLFDIVRPCGQEPSAGIQLPDIAVRVNDALRYDESIALGGKTQPLSRYFWFDSFNSGTHRDPAALIMAGPSFRHGAIKQASLLDITPTLLALFNLPKAIDMPGRVLTEHLKAQRTLRPVETYEEQQMPLRGEHLEALTPEAEEELRSLGYVR